MIYLPYILFISLIPFSSTAMNHLPFLFFNGNNIIRCGDSQVQVYSLSNVYNVSLQNIIQCANKHEFLSNHYSVFEWDHLKIVCTSSPGKVHEEHYIHRNHLNSKALYMLPSPKGLLSRKKIPYELYAVSVDGGKHITVKSHDQPANNEFYTGVKNMRRSYMYFPGYPIICLIVFFGEEDNLCSAGIDVDIVDANRICYYNPGADVEPTPEELEAEVTQAFQGGMSIGTYSYTLNLTRPNISSKKLSDFEQIIKPDSSPEINPEEKGQKETNEAAANSPENQKKSSVATVIGIVLGILILFALISGVAFYFLQEKRSNQPSAGKSPSAVNIEAGINKGAAVFSSKQSEASLADDLSNEIPTNDRVPMGKPNFELQRSVEKKRQRPGGNLAFNDDL